MSAELGLGVVPWSPLAGGVLTGKYTRADLPVGDGAGGMATTRREVAAANGSLTERSVAIADAVRKARSTSGSPTRS